MYDYTHNKSNANWNFTYTNRIAVEDLVSHAVGEGARNRLAPPLLERARTTTFPTKVTLPWVRPSGMLAPVRNDICARHCLQHQRNETTWFSFIGNLINYGHLYTELYPTINKKARIIIGIICWVKTRRCRTASTMCFALCEGENIHKSSYLTRLVRN